MMRAMVEIVPAGIDDKPRLWRLLQLYSYDFSEFTGGDVDQLGEFAYPYFDAYWIDGDRHPYLFRRDGALVGFALVRTGERHDMAEFFVMRMHRSTGVGADAAQQVFALHPGEWQTRQMPTNTRATDFWRRAIPVAFTEEVTDHGPIQRFTIPGRRTRPDR